MKEEPNVIFLQKATKLTKKGGNREGTSVKAKRNEQERLRRGGESLKRQSGGGIGAILIFET